MQPIMAGECRGATGALVLGSPTRALNELVSEERERVIELLAALTASSDVVEQQRCQILDLKHALQARVSRYDTPMIQALYQALQIVYLWESVSQIQSIKEARVSTCLLPKQMQ